MVESRSYSPFRYAPRLALRDLKLMFQLQIQEPHPRAMKDLKKHGEESISHFLTLYILYSVEVTFGCYIECRKDFSSRYSRKGTVNSQTVDSQN